MALDETTLRIIEIVVAIVGVAAAFAGAKYIRQNRQSQKMGDRSTGIQAGGNININAQRDENS